MHVGLVNMYSACMNPYGEIFSALNTAGIAYIVVGGVAMNLLGYPRFTGDIDILLALDEENLLKMNTLMKELGYEARLPVALEELGDEQHVMTLIKEKDLIAYTFIHSEKPQYSIDVIVGESLEFDSYQEHKQDITVWDIKVPVISIDDLIGMKQSTNRQKDVDDIAALLELKGL